MGICLELEPPPVQLEPKPPPQEEIKSIFYMYDTLLFVTYLLMTVVTIQQSVSHTCVHYMNTFTFSFMN